MELGDSLCPVRVSMQKSDYRLSLENFDTLRSYWLESDSPSMWDCLFTLPPWLEAWWCEFGSEGELYLRSVRQGETLLGIAPLLLKETEASFIGSPDVCDYMDFIVLQGRENDFFNILLDDLREKGIRCLKLNPLRPTSKVLTHLIGLSQKRGYQVSCEIEDVSLEMALPSTWEEYLGILTQKQRHEVRRKFRRLGEAGEVTYRIIEESHSLLEAMALFLKLFRESRRDKAKFMNDQRESFFNALARKMARDRLLKMGILDLNGRSVAMVMYFDHHHKIYLYNNGYLPQYHSLSVGFISKVMCIKDSIEKKRERFDFLKGAETYKHRLGGKEVPLSCCQIIFN